MGGIRPLIGCCLVILRPVSDAHQRTWSFGNLVARKSGRHPTRHSTIWLSDDQIRRSTTTTTTTAAITTTSSPSSCSRRWQTSIASRQRGYLPRRRRAPRLNRSTTPGKCPARLTRLRTTRHRAPLLRPESAPGESSQGAARKILRRLEGDRRLMSKEKIPVT